MSLGLTPEKLLLIFVIAVFLIGPQRLPHYAAQLAGIVRSLKAAAADVHGRIREEVGPEFDDIEWEKLDPRRYDPRRIIREAMAEPTTAATPDAAGARAPGDSPATTRAED